MMLQHNCSMYVICCIYPDEYGDEAFNLRGVFSDRHLADCECRKLNLEQGGYYHIDNEGLIDYDNEYDRSNSCYSRMTDTGRYFVIYNVRLKLKEEQNDELSRNI